MRNLNVVVLAFLLFACNNPKNKVNLEGLSWSEIKELSKGSSVTFMMWQGDPLINKYINEYIVPEVKSRFDINLNVVSGQGSQIVSTLMAEIEAGKSQSEIDMMWINGETFYQLRQIEGLYGPFVDQLPNSKFINWTNPFISFDFQQPIEGYECPWGNVQLALIYDSLLVSNPPINPEELNIWVQENPGKFTIGNDFTGMTFLKSLMIHFGGGQDNFSGAFNEELYQKTSLKLWDYLNEIKPYFWNNGNSFPSSVAQMHQLYANGELWITMSNNDAEVDNKISQGLFSASSKGYVPETGTIQNTHYLGIAGNAQNIAGSLVVINFMISPEAQLEKMKPDVWGDYSVLNIQDLPEEWKSQFLNIPGRNNAPERKIITDKALAEPAPEYMIRLFEDFRANVIEK